MLAEVAEVMVTPVGDDGGLVSPDAGGVGQP